MARFGEKCVRIYYSPFDQWDSRRLRKIRLWARRDAVNRIPNIKLHNPPLTRADTCAKHGEFEARCFLGNAWTSCATCAAEVQTKEQADAEARVHAERVASWHRK